MGSMSALIGSTGACKGLQGVSEDLYVANGSPSESKAERSAKTDKGSSYNLHQVVQRSAVLVTQVHSFGKEVGVIE